MITVFPWILGFIALGIGMLLVGNTEWLWAFVIPAVLAGWC